MQLNFLQGRECRLTVKSWELQNPDTAHFAIFILSPLFLKQEKMLLKVQADNLVCVILLLLVGIVIYNMDKGTRSNKFITSVEAAKEFSEYTLEQQPSRVQ